MIKVIIFDFDGVLNNEQKAIISSLDNISKHFNLVVEGKYLYPILNHFDEHYGFLEYDKVLEKFFSYLRINEINKAIKIFHLEFEKNLKPNFEIFQFIDREFTNFDFYIFSREKKENILNFLKKYYLDKYFKGIFAPIRKWKKDEIESLLKRIDVNPEECLVIGNNFMDIFIPKLLKCRIVLYNELLGFGINSIFAVLSKEVGEK